jgi:hypothetical protein
MYHCAIVPSCSCEVAIEFEGEITKARSLMAFKETGELE